MKTIAETLAEMVILYMHRFDEEARVPFIKNATKGLNHVNCGCERREYAFVETLAEKV